MPIDRDITETIPSEGRLWELNAELERRIAERTAELELVSEELERRRAYLETIVQHIPAGLVIADAKTGDITLANERSLEIGGARTNALLTKAAWARARATRADGKPYGPDDWPLARALTGEEVRRERVILDTERRAVLEVNAAPVRDSRGEVVAAVALFQDVTDADMRLIAASEFVANAAHELRTPLAAIVSGIEVLVAGAKDIPAERDRFLAHIAREADRLTRLSTALLQLARLQSGVEAPRTEVIPLAPVLAGVAGGLRPADGVRVSVRCSNGAAAIASRGLLEQALTSIAANAARYTDTGRITLSVAQPDGRVRIRVRDTGCGMAPEALHRAGERFYRADPTGPAGVGLGLAIARESVEAMGGSLVLASELGRGTTVDIVLPAARVVSA
jgi:signal transduction histidine kinase